MLASIAFQSPLCVFRCALSDSSSTAAPITATLISGPSLPGFDAALPSRAAAKVARSSQPEPTALDLPRAVLAVGSLITVVVLAATNLVSIDVGAL